MKGLILIRLVVTMIIQAWIQEFILEGRPVLYSLGGRRLNLHAADIIFTQCYVRRSEHL